MKQFSILIILIIANIANALAIEKKFGEPRDTTYTLEAAYAKEVKRRPNIKAVKSSNSDKIECYEGITYKEPTVYRKLKLNIYRPADKQNHPALLMVHGGGWSSGDLKMQIPMAQKIAEKGYVTIPVEYRLSPEAKYPAAVYDLKTAVRWIRANADRYHIDTTCIVISGCSAGGQLAALVGATNCQEAYEGCRENTEYTSTVHAVINIDGICDFTITESIKRIEEEIAKGKQPASVRWLGGSYSDCRGRWIAASSVYQVTQKSAPICFINSSIPRFHDGRDEMISELAKHDIYTEKHRIEDTPHTFWLFDPWFDLTVEYMTNYLDKIKKLRDTKIRNLSGNRSKNS